MSDELSVEEQVARLELRHAELRREVDELTRTCTELAAAAVARAERDERLRVGMAKVVDHIDDMLTSIAEALDDESETG